MSGGVERLAAALADRYRIERELGAGGMATVYLAHDIRHDRKVALKVLRPELSAILGGERFLAEIKTTANLQHPHILSLFDSGDADGLVYYVMPYVEGESVRDRLVREKQLPVEDAVRIAREVADALHYAHQHGIVHRDIKPENILLHGGHAMVADFGIALAASRSDSGGRMTETGMSLGTPHYMAPEQAMGEKDITPKADIYALGCVLYEMLTAEPPFTGATAQAIIARVMTEEPRSLTLQRRTIPQYVEDAVSMALAKLPADRFASAAQFADALAGQPFTATTRASLTAQHPAPKRWQTPAVVAAGVVLVVAGAWGWLRPTPPPRVIRYHLVFPDTQAVAPDNQSRSLALSPDGRRLVFVGRTAGSRRQLYVQDLDQLAPRPLGGTDGAIWPFFSPDGEWVGFFADGRLKKIALDGGPPMALADAAIPRGGAWGPNGRIVFAPSTNSPLLSVSEAGGPIDTLTRLGPGETGHRLPTFLPGGKAIVYTILGGGPFRLAAITLADHQQHPLFEGIDARWSPTGHLLYATPEGVLLAAPFDPRRVGVSGPPASVLEGLLVKIRTGAAEYTVSTSGSLAYLTGSPSQSLVLVDRRGKERQVRDLVGADSPRFSPDGRRLVMSGGGNGHIDVHVLDIERGTLARVTHDGVNTNPEWLPDGRLVAFATNGAETHGYRLFTAPPDGSGVPTRLVPQDSTDQVEVAWQPRGRTIVFRRNSGNGMDLMVASLDSTRAIRPYLDSRFAEKEAQFSPDGRYLAWVSNESSRDEVYISTFPQKSGVRQISVNGGAEPRWSRSGRELFYFAGDSLMSVSISTTPSLVVGAPVFLFSGSYSSGINHTGYDVHPDNQHFAMVRRSGKAEMIVAVNTLWGLRARGHAGTR